MNIPYIVSNDGNTESMTMFLNGVPTTVNNTHRSYAEIKEGIDTLTVPEVRALMDIKSAVQRELKRFGNITIDGDTVTYKGEVVHGLLANRMIQMLDEGYNIAPWAMFMENLQQNPAKHAVDELYLWLERSNMPITERGNFLAYKKVREDYCSYHRNADGSEFRNDIGTLCSMPRNKVDDNRHRTCSSGLHFCSWDYLPSYMGSSGKVVLVEVNPAHVVSIPADYNNAKGRAEAYMVVGEIPQEECEHAFPSPVAYFGESSWLTYDYPDDVDYTGLYDDEYDEYDDLDSEYQQSMESSYSIGRDIGLEDASYGVDNWNAAFNNLWEDGVDMDAFEDGYSDAQWEVSNGYDVNDYDETDCDEAEDLTDFEVGVEQGQRDAYAFKDPTPYTAWRDSSERDVTSFVQGYWLGFSDVTREMEVEEEEEAVIEVDRTDTQSAAIARGYLTGVRDFFDGVTYQSWDAAVTDGTIFRDQFIEAYREGYEVNE